MEYQMEFGHACVFFMNCVMVSCKLYFKTFGNKNWRRERSQHVCCLVKSKMTSLINKLADWPTNYHNTARRIPKSSAPPHSIKKLTPNETAMPNKTVQVFLFCSLSEQISINECGGINHCMFMHFYLTPMVHKMENAFIKKVEIHLLELSYLMANLQHSWNIYQLLANTQAPNPWKCQWRMDWDMGEHV